jgi:ParB family transcriptional regulator, chromosome partitioning protein
MNIPGATEARIEQIPIDQISIGVRRRQKLGNLHSLARSISARGLLHPIIVRNHNELVAGQRRLEACKQLGWKTIPARSLENLNDEELREIEFEENDQRLALADFESSKARLAQIRQAEADLRAKVGKTCSGAEQVSRLKGKRGPTRTPGSKRDIAENTGISPQSQDRIEKHVSLAEQYPFMQREGWRQYRVLEAGEALKNLPEEDRSQLAAMLDQPFIPPETSIEIIKNVAEKSARERKEIFELANSESKHNRDIALTKAANLPPPTDPSLTRIRLALSEWEKAVKYCVTDQFKEEVSSLLQKISDLEKRFTRFVRSRNGIETA